MGRMQEMHEAAARRALSLASKTEVDPLTERLDRIGPALEAISANLGGLLGQMSEFMARVETAEDGRAERLRATIAPAATAAIDAATETATSLSRMTSLATGMQDRMIVLQREMAEIRASTTAGALSRQMAQLTQILAALPDALAVRVEQTMEAAPPGPASGTRGSSAPAPSAAEIETLRLKAAAFEALGRRSENNPRAQTLLAEAMTEARANLGRGPVRPA